MKYAGAIVGATHPGVGNADNVPYPCGKEFLGDWQLAPFGHSGGTFRARVAQDENTVGVDIEGGVVDSRVHLVVAIENDGGARVLEEERFSGGGFDDGAIGSKIASENGQACRSVDRIVERSNYIFVINFRGGNIFTQSFHGDARALQFN